MQKLTAFEPPSSSKPNDLMAHTEKAILVNSSPYTWVSDTRCNQNGSLQNAARPNKADIVIQLRFSLI